MQTPVVLFVCTENVARSQMAEALLRSHAGDRFEVYSCGLRPGHEVHPLAVRVMNEMGIDISGQRPKDAEHYFRKLGVTYAVFVCAQAERQCPKYWPFAMNRLSWPVDDPGAVDGSEEEQLAAFRKTRDELNEHIQDLIRKTVRAVAAC